MLNVCIQTGRVASEPQIFESNGVKRAVFTLAVDRDVRTEDGDRDTDFIDFVAWRSTAEYVEKYLRTGDLVEVRSRLQVRRYEDSTGANRRKYELLVDHIYFIQGKKKTKNFDGELANDEEQLT